MGIVCEYNPFHNGHIYHLKKVKELYPNHLIVLVLSGNYTQRGDVSLIDKWKKTEIALNYVDLVVELPFVFAVQSADIFARGAIDILKALRVDAIIFGSEDDDTEKLKKMAEAQMSKEYDQKVLEYLNLGLNYPTSLSKALKDVCGFTTNLPNDLLGLSYIKNLNGSSIKAVSIKRTNSYLDKNLSGEISSGTSIRLALKNGQDIKKYVPNEAYQCLNDVHFIDDYFEFIKYRILSEDISKYQTVDEGIENRIKKVIKSSNNIEQLISKIKTKRYTYNKISRMLIHILTGFTKEEAKNIKTSYIRVLGFNSKGRNYLNLIKKICEFPIITKFSKDNNLLQIEQRVSDIYNIRKKESLSEHQHKPIIR